MRAFYLIVCMVSVLHASGCQSDATSGGLFIRPQMVFLGVLDGNGGLVDVEVEVVNQLTKPVVVTSIVSSCRCTVGNLTLNPIPAKSKSALVIQIDPANSYGKQVYQVDLVTDVVDFPKLSVQLSGTVVADRVESDLIYQLGAFAPGSVIDVRIPLSVSSDAVFKVVEVSCRELNVGYEVDGRELHVSGRAPDQSGIFSCDVQLESLRTDGNRLDEVVRIVIQGSCSARWEYERDVYLGFIESHRVPHAFELLFRQHQRFGGLPEVVEIECLDLAENVEHVDTSINVDNVSVMLKVVGYEIGQNAARVNVTMRYADDTREMLPVNVFWLAE